MFQAIVKVDGQVTTEGAYKTTEQEARDSLMAILGELREDEVLEVVEV